MGAPPKKAVEVLQEAIRELPADDDSELALELQTQLIGIARHDPDLHSLAAEWLERLRASLPRLSFGQDVVCANLASEASRSGAGRGEALELAERALAVGSLLKEHFDPTFRFAVGTLTAADRLVASFRLYGEAMDDARERGLAIQFCVASCFRSAVAFLRGALADAVADAELCLEVTESNGLEMIRPWRRRGPRAGPDRARRDDASATIARFRERGRRCHRVDDPDAHIVLRCSCTASAR